MSLECGVSSSAGQTGGASSAVSADSMLDAVLVNARRNFVGAEPLWGLTEAAGHRRRRALLIRR